MAKCAECEIEGLDPYHTRTVGDGPCSRHYMRQYRKTASGKAATKRGLAKLRGLDESLPDIGWCVECEKEGKDPRHNAATVLCARHMQRAYRQSPSGKEATRRARAKLRRSPIEEAYEKEKKKDSA